MNRQERWDRRWLALAEFIAKKWSKDTSTQTGAIIVRPDDTICSTGYNGYPRFMRDPLGEHYEPDRETKLSKTIHAEMNAILTSHEPVLGYTLYQWPGQSCDRCAVHIIQAGVARVVIPITGGLQETDRWRQSMQLSDNYFKEAGVSVVCLS